MSIVTEEEIAKRAEEIFQQLNGKFDKDLFPALVHRMARTELQLEAFGICLEEDIKGRLYNLENKPTTGRGF